MRFPYSLVRCACCLTVAAALIAPAASAQGYPTRPVRLVVGNLPGTGLDITARAISQKLSENLGVQVVVDNRPGAAGIIASELVSKAAPDGYTILIVNPSHATDQYVRKLPYDTARDFAPVTAAGLALRSVRSSLLA